LLQGEFVTVILLHFIRYKHVNPNDYNQNTGIEPVLYKSHGDLLALSQWMEFRPSLAGVAAIHGSQALARLVKLFDPRSA
jgi:hypothetical protein